MAMTDQRFRDPRGERAPLEERLSIKLEVIGSKLGRIEAKKDRVPRDTTDFRDVGRMYLESVWLSYSLGADPEELRTFVEPAVHWYIENERQFYRNRVDAGDSNVLWTEAPIRLIDTAQLLGVVVVLGTAEQRARIGEVIGLRGPETALEFLAGLHGDSLEGVEVTLSSPRPYGRLMKVVEAAPELRPKLMAEFVKHWYAECRKAYWWGQHLGGPKRGEPMMYDGYWCFEAAAVTQLLGIDDTLYRDNEYYPRDAFLNRS